MLLPYLNENLIEAGCDEAGRGCLAGAVYAAAVILPKDFKNEALNDAPEAVNSDPYNSGWMIKIEFTEALQLEGLMNAEEYKKHVGA